jgi:uncharacterized protein involved in exopolysaccharide biosynthesis
MSENIDHQNANLNVSNAANNNNDIDLRELFLVIWSGRWIIVAVTALFGVIAVAYALSQPNIYRSEALLAPVEQDQSSGLGGLQGQLGGLASLAGMNLGGGASGDTQLAIEILKSRHFASDFIQKYKILPDLMAPSVWHMNDNTMTYDANSYNLLEDKWIRDVAPPLVATPSMQEAYKVFSEIVVITTDDETGMVRVSVNHISPFVAQQWTEWLVSDINQVMKMRAISEAEESTAFLTSQIEQTRIADIREILFKLVEEQAKKIMFANVRDEYVFKTIDPALVPEQKAGPKRALICVLGAMLGGMLGLIIVLVRHFTKKDL